MAIQWTKTEQGLIAPLSFLNATDEAKAKVCNGAGPGGDGWWNRFLTWLIPDNLFGLNITEAANIHDWCYHLGGSRWDRIVADMIFLHNLIRLIWIDGERHRKKRIWMAIQYFIAVLLGGKKSFNLSTTNLQQNVS